MKAVISLILVLIGTSAISQSNTRLANLNSHELGARHFITRSIGELNGEFFYIQTYDGQSWLMKTSGEFQNTVVIADVTTHFSNTATKNVFPVVLDDKLYFRLNERLFRTGSEIGSFEKVFKQNGEAIEADGLNVLGDVLVYYKDWFFYTFDGNEENLLVELDMPNVNPNPRAFPVREINVADGRIPIIEDKIYFEYQTTMYAYSVELDSSIQLYHGFAPWYGGSSSLTQIKWSQEILATAYADVNYVKTTGHSFEIYHRCSQGNQNCHQTPTIRAIVDTMVFTTYMGDLYVARKQNLAQKISNYKNSSVFRFGNAAFFVGYDVTGKGTQLCYANDVSGVSHRIPETNPNGSDNVMLVAANDEVMYFSATGSSGKREMFKLEVDGQDFIVTSIFTFLDLGMSSISNPYLLGNKLIFNAQMLEASGKDVLACTDGTLVGTRLLFDGEFNGESSHPSNFTVNGNYVWYEATDSNGVRGLYEVEKINMHTKAVRSQTFPLTLGENEFLPAFLDEQMYFLALDENGKQVLWLSENRELRKVTLSENWLENPVAVVATDDHLLIFGERLLKFKNGEWEELGNYSVSNSSRFREPMEFFGEFYFFADDGVHGEELFGYRPNEGVRLISDINSGADGSLPSSVNLGFVPLNYELFFVAYTPEHGEELWKTDGSAQGTQRVSDVNEGPANGNIRSMAVGESHKLFFTGHKDNEDILFYTLGSASTVYEAELPPSSNKRIIGPLHSMKDRVYFSMISNNARSIWYSNAALSGSKAIYSSSGIHDAMLLVHNDTLIFLDGGGILIVHDGEVNGENYTSGRIPSAVNQSTNHLFTGSRLYFSGYDAFGWEPHAMKYCLQGEDISLYVGEDFIQTEAYLSYYQWYNCDTGEMIPGENGKKFYPGETGNYQCHIHLHGCEVYTECRYFEVDQSTGVNDLGGYENKLVVSPNPSDGNYSISGNAKDLNSWEIYNMQGYIIQKGSGSEVNLTEAPSGIYFLKVNNQVQKLIRK